MNNTLKQLKRITKLKRLKKTFLLAGLLLLIGVTAKAADYVFMYNGGYLAVNNSGNIVYITTFSPQCVWTCVSSTSTLDAATLGNTSSFLYATDGNGTRRWLVSSTTDGNAITTTTTAPGTARWRNNNNSRLYYRDGNDCYVYYRENTWKTSRRNNGSTYGVNAYMSGNNSGTDYRSTTIQVSTTTVTSTSTNPTISGAGVLTATGNSTYTATGAAYRAGYTNYNFSNANHYVDTNGNSFTGTPAAASIGTPSWSLTTNSYATVNSSTGVVNVGSLPENDISLTLTVTVPVSGGTPAAPANTTLTATKTIILQGTTVATPSITRSGNSVTLATATSGATIYYTTDGTTPTSSSTVYSGPINLLDLTFPVTVKAIAIRNGYNSGVKSETFNQPACEKPVITVSSTGMVTITCATEGATIRYTYGNSPEDPTGTSNVFESLTLSSEQIVKAIATKDGYDNSAVASAEFVSQGVNGSKVTLDDREDHSWSYYSDGDQPIHSLNPADVKITYYGDGIVMVGDNDYTASSVDGTDYIKPGTTNYVGGAKVNVGGENENTFVYYKTLERGDATDESWTFSTSNQSSAAARCPYTPIYNPFQVRPTYGERNNVDANLFTGWRGFQCWRLKSFTGGAVYSVASDGSALSTGAVINAGTPIYFAPNSEYGMEVVLEAVWARAYLIKGNQSEANPILSQNIGVERNFMTLTSGESYRFNGTSGRCITNVEYPVTISCYYPSGEAPNNTSSSVTGNNNNITLEAATKFENVKINVGNNYYLTANNHDLIIGRGCDNSTVGTLRGISGNADDLDYTLRVESGTFGQFDFVAEVSCTVSGRVQVKSILGCDYDRAKGINTNLSVANQSNMFFTRDVAFSNSSNKDQKVFDLVIKSGEFQKGYWDTDENPNASTTSGTVFNYVHSMYCGANFGSGNPTHYPGIRCVTIEGGALGNINGGRGTSAAGNNTNPDATTTQTDAWKVSFDLRIKNDAIINGCVFGGAANTSSWGSKRIVLTGGKVYSWIAGGANGTNTTSGDSRTRGTAYIYVGGNAEVGGPNAKMKNSTLGGQVFGAGRGFTNQAASMDTTFVVIADNAKIMKKNNDASGNVYGGGNIGYTHKQSNIYILGGTIEGSVYGGAFSNALDIPEVNITMRGGLVEGGVYGGSNSSGTISGDVTMHIDGGQVGTSSVNANVHGGGLGEPTRVKGNVDVNLGTCNASTGATVYGDVYGGSAMGKVNTDNTNTTTVSLYKGTIYGGLYGGGYGPGGEDADVNGKVAVKVYGGSVLCSASDPEGEAGTGSVFGCNNISGTPISTVTVDIYGTDQPASGYALHAVYGGGNKAKYEGIPVVTVHGCSNSIDYVYGGGNATDVNGTNVTIWGGRIGNAFGGGNGYSVTGNHTNPSAAHYNPGANITSDGTNLTIYGGTIGAAFGGSNQYGRINSTIKVEVKAQTESGSDPCSGNAYTACPMDIEELYGGGNEAPIQTSTNTWIVPTVDLDCSANIGMLFGGAKAADYGLGIDLVVEGGTYRKVFGGNNKGGTINGNVKVTFKGGTAGAVYGGCNESGTITGTLQVIIDSTYNANCNYFHVGDVYGGGDMAAYTAPTATPNYPVVNINNGTVNGSVYGGGKGATATVSGNPQVTIGDSNTGHYAIVTGNVYGGGDAAPVGTSEKAYNTLVVYNDTNPKSKVGKLFGGGNQASVFGTATVTLTSGKVISGIYGGCNASGGVYGDIAVNIHGGTVGSSSTLANIHGGGYGSGTFTSGNVTVTIGNGGDGPSIWGDVYGGSALGNVNADDASLTTKVWLKKGTVNGSLYGGGLGDADNPALVIGNVEVVVDGGSIKKIGTNPASVFGCNNVNGTPKKNVTVTINASDPTTVDGEGHKVYAINGVYGGGNLAHYDPTTPDEYPQVFVNNCATSIKDVYGGGNAAAVPYTKVTINGGDIDRVFAGGNGESGTPANVGYKNTDANPTTDAYGAGTATAIINGGTINQVFGGSNANGTIRVKNSVNVSQSTGSGSCPLHLGQVYGGGNVASGPAGEITIGCTGDETIDYIYGGANNADVDGDVILNIYGGRFNNVFGGNNAGGKISGKIVVNIDWSEGTCSSNYIGNVYGGGNLAPYTAPTTGNYTGKYPEVNIINCVVSNEVYGGGLGESAIVEGNPQVTIGAKDATVMGNVYGGGNAAKVDGSTFVMVKNKAKLMKNIYGGGNAAKVTGDTKVIVNGTSSNN